MSFSRKREKRDQYQNDYKIQNLERIITKLKCTKPSDSTKCNFVNTTTIKFQGTHSERFGHPSIQPKRLKNWLPKPMNIPGKRLVQRPKTNHADDKGNSNTEVVLLLVVLIVNLLILLTMRMRIVTCIFIPLMTYLITI